MNQEEFERFYKAVWILINSSTIPIYLTAFIGCSRKIGPITPLDKTSAHIIIFGEWRDEGSAVWGFLFPQIREFCLLTKPSRWKNASSELHFVYVANIEFTVIHKLQHGVKEIVMYINGISTEGSVSLDFFTETCEGCAKSLESSTRCNSAYGSSGPLLDNMLYGIQFCNWKAFLVYISKAVIIHAPRSFKFLV